MNVQLHGKQKQREIATPIQFNAILHTTFTVFAN